jgi:hypothetical protein
MSGTASSQALSAKLSRASSREMAACEQLKYRNQRGKEVQTLTPRRRDSAATSASWPSLHTRVNITRSQTTRPFRRKSKLFAHISVTSTTGVPPEPNRSASAAAARGCGTDVKRTAKSSVVTNTNAIIKYKTQRQRGYKMRACCMLSVGSSTCGSKSHEWCAKVVSRTATRGRARAARSLRRR